MKRSSIIVHWRDAEASAPTKSESGEAFGFVATLGERVGLSRLAVSHVRVPPGARSNVPLAAWDEERFWYVLEGAPDLFFDGNVYRMKEGEGVTLNADTGMSTTFLNNGDRDVRLFFMGEGARYSTRYVCGLPRDAQANKALEKAGKLWTNPPKRKLGAHDGLTEASRGSAVAAGRVRKPEFVAHWRDRFDPKPQMYRGSNEPQGLNAPFGKPAKFSRIGMHLEVLKPGRRTSYPHAERDEEEFVYVAGGRVDCWLDGYVYPMEEGDFVGWRGGPGDGVTHVIMNNSDEDALLIVGGEASRLRSRCWYPYHPHRAKEMGDNHWVDHPVPKLGPHDGMPDALRAKVPKRLQGDAMRANKAAIWIGKKPKRKKR
jgi:uncharacterized cupin superfamily protein